MCEVSKDPGKKMKIWVNVNMIKRMIILKRCVRIKEVKMMDKVKTVEKSRR